MNGVEIGGNMDTLKDKMVTTQKEHTCWGCGIKHPKGTRMRYTVCVDGGDLSSPYWCNICEAVLDELEYWEKEDGFRMGDIKDEYNDLWVEISTQI